MFVSGTARAQGTAHFEIVDRARQLMRNRNYDEAIATLAPVYTESLSAAMEFARAYESAQGRRLEFVERVRPEAEKGNPFVSYALAMTMRRGYVLEPRSVERYLLNAVRGGIATAAEELGNIYFYGLEAGGLTGGQPSISMNLEKARDMFQMCANDSSRGRACSIGLAHLFLELRADRPQDAISLFERAKAYDALWGMHYYGIGAPIDLVKASAYLALAKSTDSSHDLIGCAFEARDYADLVAKDDPKALIDAAFSLSIQGKRADCIPGGPKHYIALLERAFRAGSPQAAMYLGDEYYFGKLARKEPVLAYYYYSAASQDGNASQRREANSNLTNLERMMSPADLSEARSMVRRGKDAVGR
jgi:TPR repeat protein